MAENLSGARVAILIAYGFEEIEATSPKTALEHAGAEVSIVGVRSGLIQGFDGKRPAGSIRVGSMIDDAAVTAFDALIIPGGLFSPDALRQDDRALAFVRSFFKAGKLVAAICHGPQLLISAEVVAGRRVTAVAPVQIDLANAGATVVDEPAVEDGNLITSRGPGDLDAFNAALKRMLQNRLAAKSKSA